MMLPGSEGLLVRHGGCPTEYLQVSHHLAHHRGCKGAENDEGQ